MGKRILRIIMFCLSLLLFGAVQETVSAANISTPYIAEQATGKAPNVKVYMLGSKMDSSSTVTGSIGEIDLSLNGDIVNFQESGEGISYIILMDNSGSVNKDQFEETKEQLKQMRQSLGEGDEMTLYTVGTDNSEGEKTLVFQRSVTAKDKKKKKSDCEQIDAIEYMSSADSKTVLYRSLNQVLKEQTSPKMRTVVLLITDGEDDSEGKDIDNVSTANTVKEASVPVYGILLNRKTSKSGNREEQDEKVSYTKNDILAEKNCRGFYYDCSVDATKDSVDAAFETIQTILEQETYVVNLQAGTNQVTGKEDLVLTVDSNAVDPIPLDYSDYEEDQDAPAIVGDIKEVSANSISFSMQDKNGVNMEDVNETSNYMIQTVSEGEDGKIWTIASVSAEGKGNEITVTVTMTEDFYNDTYTLRCTNIRDTSQDKNAMNATVEFSIANGLNEKDVLREEKIKSYWWIALLLLVLIIGIILIIIIHRKKSTQTGLEPEELVQADTKQIRLTITDRAGLIKDVEWNVEGSLFVGRSDICNIFFDDDRLSKQHFVVEVNKMGCYIEDLESTNGTFVNGVKLTNRRMLLDGDVINAGREKFVFHIPKQELTDKEAE